MRKSTTAAVLALGATSSMAQMLPSEIFGLSFSQGCQQAVLQVFTNSSVAQCLPLGTLLPVLASNTSVIPYLDNFMSQLCYSAPCSDDALNQAAQTIIAGCSADLQGENLSDSVVTTAFGTYPLVRELLCLKTTEEYTEESYGGFLGPAPIPIDEQTYNSTDGYFCVTSLLTQYSAYLGADLSVPYVTAAATGANSTALDLVKSTNPNVLCNDCVFAGLSLIDEAYPVVGNTPLSVIFGVFGMQSPVDGTINGYANETCAYNGQAVSPDGELPDTVTVSIVDSTFDSAYSS